MIALAQHTSAEIAGRSVASLLGPSRETTAAKKTSFQWPVSVWSLLKSRNSSQQEADAVGPWQPGSETRGTPLITSLSHIAPEQLILRSHSSLEKSREAQPAASSSSGTRHKVTLLEDSPTLFGALPILIGQPPPMMLSTQHRENTAAPPGGYIRIHREADPPTIFSPLGSSMAASFNFLGGFQNRIGAMLPVDSIDGSMGPGQTAQAQQELQHASDFALDADFLASLTTPASMIMHMSGAQNWPPPLTTISTSPDLAEDNSICGEAHIAALLEATHQHAGGSMATDSHIEPPSEMSLDEAFQSTSTPASVASGSHPVQRGARGEILSMTARLHHAALLEDGGALQTASSIVDGPARHRSLNQHEPMTASAS